VKPWTVKRSRVIYERRWLRLREDHVLLPGGGEIEEFHVVEGPDWTSIVALTEDFRLLLVDQYRHGMVCVSRELPAGVIEPGEQPLDAARRELLEETGYASDDWQPLISLSPEPNRMKTRAHFFLARGARRVSEPRPDPSEQLRVVLLGCDEVLAALDSGEICHGVHAAAILLAARRGLFGDTR
jgi:8-oxo-dGTP pyrophosphatase MutT (NUDIX family)